MESVGDTVAISIFFNGEAFVQASKPFVPPTLSVDIAILLNKNLFSDEASDWYKKNEIWFIKEEVACKCKAVQEHPFLYTGKKLAVGQRLQIAIMLPNGCWRCLSGELMHELLALSDDDLKTQTLCFTMRDKSRNEI